MSDQAETIVRLRFLVAALGETASPPWWRSQVLSVTGQRLLERIYPRTHLRAGLEIANRAARIVHDARIGRVGTFHLFRLPSGDEAAIHDLLASPEGRLVLEKVSQIDPAERLDSLLRLAGNRSSRVAPGPTRCGGAADRHDPVILQQICAAYAAGFESGSSVYPFLDEVRP